MCEKEFKIKKEEKKAFSQTYLHVFLGLFIIFFCLLDLERLLFKKELIPIL